MALFFILELHLKTKRKKWMKKVVVMRPLLHQDFVDSLIDEGEVESAISRNNFHFVCISASSGILHCYSCLNKQITDMLFTSDIIIIIIIIS